MNAAVSERRIGSIALALALGAVPVSIALAESLLGVALAARLVEWARTRRLPIRAPRIFWFWLAWAALEIVSWAQSPGKRLGWGEMRHLLLIAALFLALPALSTTRLRVNVWRGIFLTSTLNSLVLIAVFFDRLWYFNRQPPYSLYAPTFLRNGGLLHHWMIYATVEVIVFAALLEFHQLHPRERRWALAALLIQSYAIVVSFTRMLWVCALVLLGLHFLWRRSKWILATPALLLLVLAAPAVVRSRMIESLDPGYYTNADRVQMLKAGWNMLRSHPFAGVGPGRVEELYPSYIPPGQPVPPYHGHLHNNAVQLAAEFGWPVVVAALVFLVALLRDLWRRHRSAAGRDEQFLCRTSLLALAGFLLAGTMEYTYGHSLGLILLSFAVLSPLIPASEEHSYPAGPTESSAVAFETTART